MGDRWLAKLGPNDAVTFVDSPEQDMAEVNRPDAVVDLLKADRMSLAFALTWPPASGAPATACPDVDAAQALLAKAAVQENAAMALLLKR